MRQDLVKKSNINLSLAATVATTPRTIIQAIDFYCLMLYSMTSYRGGMTS